MPAAVQLCVFVLYTLCSTVFSQDRLWHTTTPPSLTPSTSQSPTPSQTLDPSTTTVTFIPAITTTTPETSTTLGTTPTTTTQGSVEDAITEADMYTPPVLSPESLVDTEGSGESTEQSVDQGESLQDLLIEEKATLEAEIKKEAKPRKWMSLPSEEELPLEVEEPVSTTEASPGVDEFALNANDLQLPQNISDLLQAAEEEGVPMIQETIISKKTTIYVTITESVGDKEPVYVNLTGIRDFTGQERRIVSGCLDLSDLSITGEEAKEIIQRMSRHKFHRLDLSNNMITEFPTNTFSPVAFTVRELRLDGNPLLSNNRGEGSMLQRGGLFHLTELRELNLSRCGLHDIDFFTPWNSNRLELVDLSNNQLRAVPTNLQFFHKLRKLALDGNPITQISELPFALLWNLQVLSMSSCLVSSITSDPFRNMEHLKELSLDGNNLTHITDVHLARGVSGVKMYLSSNPWHCACDMLTFIERFHYAIRDLEEIRCSSPRWLEGLRTAYLTKEILSLDSVDGDCSPPRHEVAAPITHRHYPVVRTDRLEVVSLAVFVLAAVFMLLHILWSKKRDKYTPDDERSDINYIRIDRKPNFK